MAQANYFTNLGSALIGRMSGQPQRVSPFKEAGTSGTAVFGGYVEVIERNRKLGPGERYITASDLLANISIIAAGLRFFLNLTAKPAWKVSPAKDMPDGESSDGAKRAAEFVEACMGDMTDSWARIVRRSAMFRFHGFGIHEWTAKRRDDGLIGFESVESRPQHTIERWEVDPRGTVLGVTQRSPQTGEFFFIPRSKVIYLVDDALTDSPEGMGLFRHLVEPGERMKQYLKLEGLGFERDLRGIPVARAPMAEIQAAEKAGIIDAAQAANMLDGLRKFVRMQVKAEDTGLILDSSSYEGTTGEGNTISTVGKWGVDLLTAQANGIGDLGKAIERVRYDMAMILGCEQMLLGATSSGSRALSADKSSNFYLNVNATLGDLSSGYGRDYIGPLWMLNGFPDELKPTFETEDAAFKDVQQIATTLADMAQAGAVMDPNDPAINDLRDLLGVSRQPEITPELLAALNPAPVVAAPGGEKPGDKPKPKEPA